ncbi:MAG: glycosyltransferase family 39 protein [Chloroflexota bacterium]
MVGLLLLAFWLRVANLAIYPPGVSNDEATDVIDAFNISHTGYYPFYEDFGRPEPLSRFFEAAGVLLWGSGVWSSRFTSALIGLVTVAIACWTMRQCLRDLDPRLRWVCGFAAAAVLAISISHVALSRAIYRGILQPPFMLLFIGFLLRGLQSNQQSGRNRYFVLSGIAMAGALYSYTAALALPASLLVVAVSLLLFRRMQWRLWLGGLAILVLVFTILMIPVGVRFLDRPAAIIGRAADVSGGARPDYVDRASRLVGQFYNRGDVNPQYNAAEAPLLPPIFNVLFSIGLLALVVRGRQPSSALLAAILVLSALPVLATEEIPHGLRVVGEFAVFPLIIGAGVAFVAMLILQFTKQQSTIYRITLALLVIVTAWNGWQTRTSYITYWSQTRKIHVYNVDMLFNEWFFRTDNRDFADWLNAQTTPMLIPLDELNEQTIRAELFRSYPNISTADETFRLPTGTRLVIPYALETGDLRRFTRLYGLLHNGTITLLPPFSAETQATLLANIDEAEAVQRPNGVLLARVKPLSNAQVNEPLAFEPRVVSGSMAAPLAIFDQQMQVLGWRGPDTLSGSQQGVAYTLDWAALHKLGHEYSAFVQLQTQDRQKVAGEDVTLWNRLYPSTVWAIGDVIPFTHILSVPPLPPGAYRLVAGVYVYVDKRLPAFASNGDSLGDAATLGWIKVPPPTAPVPPPDSLPINATIGDKFALRHWHAEALDSGHVRLSLYWESLTRRPALDVTIFVHLLDKNGTMISQQDARPLNGQYPTFIWDQGELVQTDYMLETKSMPLNTLSIEVGMYTFPDQARLPVVQNGESAADKVIQLGKLSSTP